MGMVASGKRIDTPKGSVARVAWWHLTFLAFCVCSCPSHLHVFSRGLAMALAHDDNLEAGPGDEEVVDITLRFRQLHVQVRAAVQAASTTRTVTVSSPQVVPDGRDGQTTATADAAVETVKTVGWPERLDDARHAGEQAASVLGGGTHGPRSVRCQLRPNYYVVLRGADDDFNPARVCSTWASAKKYVLDGGRIVERAVFHGWPSVAEARAYVQAAGRDWPEDDDVPPSDKPGPDGS